MTEHVHEYSQEYDDDFICIHCGHMLSFQEALPKINATERLSAEVAYIAAESFEQTATPHFPSDHDGIGMALIAYADTLEGK